MDAAAVLGVIRLVLSDWLLVGLAAVNAAAYLYRARAMPSKVTPVQGLYSLAAAFGGFLFSYLALALLARSSSADTYQVAETLATRLAIFNLMVLTAIHNIKIVTNGT